MGKHRSPDVLARRALYNSTRWRKASKAYLRVNRVCVYCGGPATMVDHVYHGPDWCQRFFSEQNWAASCRPCNSRKSWQGKEAQDNGNATRHADHARFKKAGVLPGGYRARGGGAKPSHVEPNATGRPTSFIRKPQKTKAALVAQLRGKPNGKDD